MAAATLSPLELADGLQVRLSLDAVAGPAPAAADGRFEILAISAGEGNGWLFSAAALQASLPLWQGAECFVDHALSGRSLRDLAGVFSQPAWDEAARGIRLVLHPAGPSGPLAAALGREMTAQSAAGKPLPGVGFSADLLFRAEGRQVTEILKVLSVDVVIHPARGGKFLRSLQSASAPAPALPAMKWIKATVGKQIRLINVADVLFFQSDTKYTRVVLADSEALIRTPIKDLLSSLDPEQFWQIHRSFMVNVHQIAAAERVDAERMQLILKDHSEKLPVSRNFTHLFRE